MGEWSTTRLRNTSQGADTCFAGAIPVASATQPPEAFSRAYLSRGECAAVASRRSVCRILLSVFRLTSCLLDRICQSSRELRFIVAGLLCASEVCV